jgi:hypothetical protein
MEKECPKCKIIVIPEYDKISIQYGAKGYCGDVNIQFCPECGHIFDDGTWVE